MGLKKHLFSRTSYIIMDVLVINISLFTALFMKFNSLLPFFMEWDYKLFFLFSNISWLVFSYNIKPYIHSKAVGYISNLKSYYRTALLHFFSLTFFIFIVNLDHISRAFSLYYIFLVISIILVTQFLLNIILRKYKNEGFKLKNVILIGQGDITKDIQALLRNNPEYGFNLKAIFSNKENVIDDKTYPFSRLRSYVLKNPVNEIYCCIPYVSYEQIQELIQFGDDHFIRIKLITDYRGFAFKKLELERYGDIPLISISTTPLENTNSLNKKRVFDILFSSVIIICILSWLHPILAIWIKCSSKGTVLFKQQRHGKNDKLFNCFKFRSMKVNKECDTKEAAVGDVRVTNIGKFMRKTSLDEMPQFYNVFLGHMSIVGPRPAPINFYKEYVKRVKKFSFRHHVKPGITGLAQSKGYRGSTDEPHSLEGRYRLDRFYVENWSLALDLKIIYLTIISLCNNNNNAY